MKNFIYGDEVFDVVDENGDKYRLRILQDDFAENPREWDNLGKMICWHRNYNLGDKHKYSDPEDFFKDLVSTFVPKEKVLEYAKTENNNVRLSYNEAEKEWELYVYYSYEGKWMHEVSTDYNSMYDYLLEELSISSCEILLRDYIVILPLYLYEHGGITMSTGSFNDRWDSGQVGYIYASKERFISETGYSELELFSQDCHRTPVLNENVKLTGFDLGINGWGKVISIDDVNIVVDFDCNKFPTYKKPENIITVSLSEVAEVMANWAEQILKCEVEIYDQYLRGDVYGFSFEKIVECDCCGHTEYEEIDSCWGFYGNTLEQTGILSEIGSNYKIVS